MEHFKQYLYSLKISDKSIQSMITTVNRHLKWLKKEGVKPQNADYNLIISYVKSLNQKGIKQRTVQLYINAIRHYYNYLQKVKEVIDENPTQKVKIKGIKHKLIHDAFTNEELNSIYKDYTNDSLIGIRNKNIVGLMVYQGLKSEELGKLLVSDINYDKKNIQIISGRRSNSRILEIKDFQVVGFQNYINETRNSILQKCNKASNKLFVSMGKSDQFSNIIQKLMVELRKQDQRIVSLKQIRASVITNWVSKFNLRKAQYMAGHRYVSSTEKYYSGNMEELTIDIEKFHPMV